MILLNYLPWYLPAEEEAMEIEEDIGFKWP